MSFLAGALPTIASLLFPGAGALGLFNKKKKLVQPRPVTRDEGREALEAGEELRRRKGAAADLITGTRGAEAAAGSVGRLVLGS
jgi:hypothetical protein